MSYPFGWGTWIAPLAAWGLLILGPLFAPSEGTLDEV